MECGPLKHVINGGMVNRQNGQLLLLDFAHRCQPLDQGQASQQLQPLLPARQAVLQLPAALLLDHHALLAHPDAGTTAHIDYLSCHCR